METKLTALAGLCLLMAGCAQTGAPLPPSLELPKPPSDLHAIRKGNSVTLTWTEPRLTTDRQTVRSLGPTLICRTGDSEMKACGNPVKFVSPSPAPPGQKSIPAPASARPAPQTYTDALPVSLQSEDPSADLIYAIEVLNRNARGAGLSNRVRVPAIATIPAPGDLAVNLTGDGVLLTWTSSGEPSSQPGIQHRFRIYRRLEGGHDEVSHNELGSNEDTSGQTVGKNAGKNEGRNKNGNDAIAGELPADESGPMHFLDSIQWEQTYQYRITVVTIITRPGSEVQVEGDDSPAVRVVAHDVFPPNVPAGLQAVYSGEGQKSFIDLIWAPVTSADLAGYNIYRSEADGAAVKLNSELVKSPSYRDSAVLPGRTYVYSVSAVDARGNESARSDQTSESVP